MRTAHLAWLVLFILSTDSFAQAPAKRAITIDDYFTQADIFGLAYSAKHIAYTEGRWQEATDDRKADLWIVPTAGALTRSRRRH